MKRWGILGLLAVAACAPEDPYSDVSEARECPDVSAGSLPNSAEPVARMAQHVWSTSPASRLEADGREPVLVRFRRGTVSASSVERTGGQVRQSFNLVPALAARRAPRSAPRSRRTPTWRPLSPTWSGRRSACRCRRAPAPR